MLQQPMQTPMSDNTNVLWNSPSLGKNYYPWFYKTLLFYLLKGKKQGQTHLFFLVYTIIWDASKTAKNQWNCIVLNFNQIKASLFKYKFKSIFLTKSTQMPFTFSHKSFLFISFMSNRKFSYIFSAALSSCNISSQSLTGLLFVACIQLHYILLVY